MASDRIGCDMSNVLFSKVYEMSSYIVLDKMKNTPKNVMHDNVINTPK